MVLFGVKSVSTKAVGYGNTSWDLSYLSIIHEKQTIATGMIQTLSCKHLPKVEEIGQND